MPLERNECRECLWLNLYHPSHFPLNQCSTHKCLSTTIAWLWHKPKLYLILTWTVIVVEISFWIVAHGFIWALQYSWTTMCSPVQNQSQCEFVCFVPSHCVQNEGKQGYPDLHSQTVKWNNSESVGNSGYSLEDREYENIRVDNHTQPLPVIVALHKYLNYLTVKLSLIVPKSALTLVTEMPTWRTWFSKHIFDGQQRNTHSIVNINFDMPRKILLVVSSCNVKPVFSDTSLGNF